MGYAPQSKENSNPQHQQHSTKATTPTFADERESTTAISPLQAMMANSPQQQKLKSTAQLMANSPAQQRLNTTAQSFANKPESIQRMEDEELLQAKFESEPTQLEAAAEAPCPNNTGLPDNLKSGIENLSGMSMEHVKVHYNSDKPAQLQAHAYAQGSEIHVAPGQEQHLPHEAWHVVQQAQGRVKPTVQMKGDVQINDDVGLEREADLMGAKAMQLKITPSDKSPLTSNASAFQTMKFSFGNPSVQRILKVNGSNVSRALIEGHQEDFKRWCGPPMSEAGYDNLSDEQWAHIFNIMDAVAADARVFNFARTSHLMRKIMEGQNIEAIASEYVEQLDVQKAKHSSGQDIEESPSSGPDPKPKQVDASAPRGDSPLEKDDGSRKIEIHEGVFSGSFECGPDRNWADLHVVGATGGRADPGALLRYFKTVHQLMLDHFKFTQVPGVLEWHPTGAVVTKQIIELLGESIGSWTEWGKAKYEQKKRRNADKKSNLPRNKLAGKISPEFVPEHLHFLKSLKNAKGLSIGARGLPIPEEIKALLRSDKAQHMKPEEIEALMSPDLTSNSLQGNAALLSYEQALEDPEQEEGPSLVIKLDFRQLPKLMKKLG